MVIINTIQLFYRILITISIDIVIITLKIGGTTLIKDIGKKKGNY